MSTVKTTSSATILSEVYRTFKPDDSDWVNDAQEWVFDAVLFIECDLTLEKGPIIKSVEDHRVKIPCNVETIDWIEYKGDVLLIGSDVTGYNLSKDYPRTTTTKPRTPYFLFNHGYINTSFETGEVKLHCEYIPFDDNGNISIINNAHHKRFITWYVYAQMLMSGYKAKDASLNFEYANTYAMETLLPRAQNATKHPSPQKMQRLTSLFTRMRADISAGGNNHFINHETAGARNLE